MNAPLRLYAQIYPYLSEEARRLIKMLTDRGMDQDLAAQLVEMVMTEEEFYEL